MDIYYDRAVIIFCFIAIVAFFALTAYFMFNNIKIESDIYKYLIGITFVVLILSFINYKIGLYAFTISVGISPELEIMNTPNFRFEDLIFPVTLFSWFTYFLKEKKEFNKTGLTAPMVLYLLSSILSYLFSLAMGNSWLRLLGFYEIGKLLQYYIIFLIFANSFENVRDIKQAIWILIISFAIAGIVGSFIIPPQIARAALHEGPNIQGGYYSLSLCVLTGILATLTDPLLWLALLAIAASLFYPLVLTLSRTSYVAFVVGILTSGILRARKIILWLIIFFAIAATLQHHTFFERASSILYVFTSNPPSSWEARVSGWQAYASFFYTSPIFGLGTGFTPRTIDNEYIKVLVDKGIVGITIFLWLIISFLRLAIKTHKLTKEDILLNGYTLGFLAATIAILVHSIGAVSFTVIRVAELYYMMLGIEVAILNAVMKKEAETKTIEEEIYF
jgi:hypothetical protein